MVLKRWMLKAAGQKIISFLPFRNQINFWFQKHLTKGVELDGEHLHWKLTHARDHLQYFTKNSQVKDPVCLELGTGWYPIVPLLLYLHGAQKILTIDLNAHLTKDTLFTGMRKILEQGTNGGLFELFPGIHPDRWEMLNKLLNNKRNHSLKEILNGICIEAIVGDARQLPIADSSFDWICSNNTFEHIFPDVLKGILQEFKRVIKPGGVMSHFIDLSDHFAHFDPSITIYNFLRFSDRQWSRIDNLIQPQNRLRWPQYKTLYQSLNIPITEETVRPGNPDLLKQVPVHPEWSEFTQEALAISHGYLVSVFQQKP